MAFVQFYVYGRHATEIESLRINCVILGLKGLTCDNVLDEPDPPRLFIACECSKSDVKFKGDPGKEIASFTRINQIRVKLRFLNRESLLGDWPTFETFVHVMFQQVFVYLFEF